jgi:hypothetical protein
MGATACGLNDLFDDSYPPISELPRIVPVTAPPTPYEWSRVPVDQEFVLEVELRLADGSLARDYEFAWGGPFDGMASVQVVRETPEPGRERLRLRTSSYAYIPGIGCRVQSVDPTSGLATGEPHTLGPFPVVFYGNTPVDVALPPAEVRLGLGERRPLAVFPGAVVESNRIVGKPSHLQATLTSLNPDIVRVEGDGLTLSAQAQGAAKVQVRVGDVLRVVDVTVDNHPLGPPTAETLRPAAPRTSGLPLQPRISHTSGAVRGDYLLTVDSRGYPFFTFEMNSALWLSSWTGTDFGHEPVTAPGEEVDEPGSVTVDERGRLYVAYRAFGGLVVAERQADGAASTWSRRNLFPLASLHESQEWLPTVSSAGAIAIHPKRGGGVWVLSPLEFKQASGRDRCRTVVRLYSVDDSGVSAETVGESVRDGECELTSFSSRWQTSVHLFGQRPGLPKPDLQASGADPSKSIFLAQPDGSLVGMPLTSVKPGRPDGAGAMGVFLMPQQSAVDQLPADAPARVYVSTDVVDQPRFFAGANYLVYDDIVLPVVAGRLAGPRILALRLIDDVHLLDAVNPLQVIAKP